MKGSPTNGVLLSMFSRLIFSARATGFTVSLRRSATIRIFGLRFGFFSLPTV